MQQNQQQTECPFVREESHIYNKLCNNPQLSVLDFGWKIMTIHIAQNLNLDGVPCDGVTEFDECAIKLDSRLTDLDARETLLHEIMHCFLECIGMHEKNFGNGFISTTNEFLADTLGKQLSQFRRLNPGVFDTIMSHDPS